MKQEHLGDGAYITVNRDYVGQVILTANHHDERQASDIVHLELRGLKLALEIYERDIAENYNGTT